MNSFKKNIILQAAAVLAFSMTAAAADYAELAGRLGKAAAANGITRVALSSFSALAGSDYEAVFAREKTAAGLSSIKGLVVLDQEALEGYGGAGAWKKLPGKARPQAFIKGALFRAGEEVTLLAKLVDASSGRVIETAEARSYARFSEVPPVPDMNWDKPPATAPMGDMRDALSDNGIDCKAAFKQMNKINSAAVDLKARYWARKIKESGFVYGSLTRNPGSEIRDRGTRSKFYELLTAYHERDSVPPLPAEQAAKLEAFMGRESDVIDRCGTY